MNPEKVKTIVKAFRLPVDLVEAMAAEAEYSKKSQNQIFSEVLYAWLQTLNDDCVPLGKENE